MEWGMGGQKRGGASASMGTPDFYHIPYWEQDVTNKKPHQKTATEINIALTLIVPGKMCILHC